MATGVDAAFAVTSPDLSAEQRCPVEFTPDGGDRLPRIRITGAPPGTVELALVCHDPDAPLPHGFTHWAVYGIPPDPTVEVGPTTVGRFRVGPNELGDHAWTGPRPPVGHGVHHYFFWVYALARPVEGAPTREVFLEHHGRDVIAQARLVVTFARPPEG